MTVKALVIVDLQNDFISGSLAVPGGEGVAKKISEYLATDPDYDVVVTTQDWHINPGDHFSDTPDFKDTWPQHCVAGTHGAWLSDELSSWTGAVQFYKGQHSAAYSGFEGFADGVDLEEFLSRKGVVEVDVVGIATDFCVKATALDSVKAGFRTTVLLNYTAAVTPEGEAAACREMTEAGVTVVPDFDVVGDIAEHMRVWTEEHPGNTIDELMAEHRRYAKEKYGWL